MAVKETQPKEAKEGAISVSSWKIHSTTIWFLILQKLITQ